MAMPLEMFVLLVVLERKVTYLLNDHVVSCLGCMWKLACTVVSCLEKKITMHLDLSDRIICCLEKQNEHSSCIDHVVSCIEKENFNAYGKDHIVCCLDKENYNASGRDHVVSCLEKENYAFLMIISSVVLKRKL
jgi:hypothetical protein